MGGMLPSTHRKDHFFANEIQQVGPGVDRKPETFRLPTTKPEEKKEEPKK